MNTISSVTDLFEALGRDPEELIGLLESEWLEFKKEPYFLDDANHKFEVAKDVSAMANAGEGVIVIGVDTALGASSRREVATALRPVAKGVIDAKRLQETIHSWVWPRLDVEIRSHPVRENPGELWTLRIARQRERDLPFMVAREYLTPGKISRLAFAIYERHSSENVPYSPQQVHQWVRHGFSAEAEPAVAVPDSSLGEQAAAILADDVKSLATPEGWLWYYVQAHALRAIQLPAFYQGGPGTVFDAMSRIQSLRGGHGFSLPDGRPERTTWDGLRVVWDEDTSVSISRSGVVTAIIAQRYLTWGVAARQAEVWLNPLALVEFTLEFWRFFASRVVERETSVSTLAWRAGMRNLGGPYQAALPGGELRKPIGIGGAERALINDFDLPWTTTRPVDPEVLAFHCLVEIYAKFGLGETQIPYSDSEENRVLGPAIQAVRRQ